jgi:hypothetical protein
MALDIHQEAQRDFPRVSHGTCGSALKPPSAYVGPTVVSQIGKLGLVASTTSERKQLDD